MTPLLSSYVFQMVFVIFMIMANWAVLAILTAVVSDNMLSSTQRHDEAEKKQALEIERRESIRRLRDIIQELDLNGDGTVSQAEFSRLLSSEALSAELCDATGLPK